MGSREQAAGGGRAGRWPQAAGARALAQPPGAKRTAAPSWCEGGDVFFSHPLLGPPAPLARTLALTTTCEPQISEERPGELGEPAPVEDRGSQ